MIIHVKNNNTLIIDDFRFKCCVGKKGLKLNKKEGDGSTPRGLYSLKNFIFERIESVTQNANLKKKLLKRIQLGVMIQIIKNIIKKYLI